jgi:hypothetical protein
VATHLESYSVHSPEHGKTLTLDIVEGLDGAHLDFIESDWDPALKRQYELALLKFFELSDTEQTDDQWIQIMGDMAVQDRRWDWRNKCAIAPGTNRRVFGILNGSEVEAAMLLLFGKTSRHAPPAPIVYVDYVAVAPWNRPPIQTPQRFRGLGTVLMGKAVTVSHSSGFQGRCGLHSLPQSIRFYQKLGMTDLGADPAYQSLHYFEFTDTAAQQFLTRGIP